MKGTKRMKLILACPYCGCREWEAQDDGEYVCAGCGKAGLPGNMDIQPEEACAGTYPAEFTDFTRIGLFRQEGFRIETYGPVYAVHKPGDVMDMIDACFTAWFRTPKGKKAYERTCSDFNMGDWLNGDRPDDSMTEKYGFILMDGKEGIPGNKVLHMHELSISCDRLIGDGDAAEDDEELYKAACEYMSRTERYNRTLSGMRSQFDKTKAHIPPSMQQFSNINANNVRVKIEDKYGITYAELFDEIKRHKGYTAQMWIDEYERLQKEEQGCVTDS